MPRRSVVLGWPASLILRGANALTGLGGKLSPVSSLASKIAANAPAVSALTVVTPWVNDMIKSRASDATGAVGGIAGVASGISGILTFADMNAQVVKIQEKRRMAVVSIPGRESDFLQDLGGHSTRYQISGKFFAYDPNWNKNIASVSSLLGSVIQNGATANTQMLRLLMRMASPVPFMCEHDISTVIIESFDTEMAAGEPEYVNYTMSLIEYTRIPYLAKIAMLGASNLFGGT